MIADIDSFLHPDESVEIEKVNKTTNGLQL
ncbi:hypothetical protein KL86CLO1_11211 [uncultured Eubacteriales bacterium]|uniref:Uncharacterized protein n=1 Tax=uncultured Eubacteriales bacterium TaxID=172733 RepID=A0A212JJB2_9FIRM|nr:hypothetical protein KL86CLO1_11211 [uncultured Eubacteriales bacterium]